MLRFIRLTNSPRAPFLHLISPKGASGELAKRMEHRLAELPKVGGTGEKIHSPAYAFCKARVEVRESYASAKSSQS